MAAQHKCLNCKDRYPGCHDKCEDYKQAKKKRISYQETTAITKWQINPKEKGTRGNIKKAKWWHIKKYRRLQQETGRNSTTIRKRNFSKV